MPGGIPGGAPAHTGFAHGQVLGLQVKFQGIAVGDAGAARLQFSLPRDLP